MIQLCVCKGKWLNVLDKMENDRLPERAFKDK